jgi:hypothetical protein
LEIIKTLLENKIKQAQLGETTYNEALGETERLETSIALAKLELAHLAREQNVLSMQLVEMQKASRMSFWPKPILHLDRPLLDAPTMIIMK